MAKGLRKKAPSKPKEAGRKTRTLTSAGRRDSVGASEKTGVKTSKKTARQSRASESESPAGKRAFNPPAKPLKKKEPTSEDADRYARLSLPDEYGENDLFLIAVDPEVVYSSWEVRRDAIPGGSVNIMLRFFDVTGVVFNGKNAKEYRDIPLKSRIGTGFFSIDMPGKDVIVELGCVNTEGKYRTILRSNLVSIPQWPPAGQPASWRTESEGPVGY